MKTLKLTSIRLHKRKKQETKTKNNNNWTLKHVTGTQTGEKKGLSHSPAHKRKT